MPPSKAAGPAARLVPYALAFFASLCIMTLELVASRLVARHVGASLNVWTSVIGVVLGGICLGNFLGGRLADRVEPRRAVGPLFAMGAALTLGSLWVNAAVGLLPGLDALPWNLRTVLVVALDFLVPATVLGLIGPVVAKVAVDQAGKTGSALGDVYFWGAVGSIAGTFLTGFVLIERASTSTIVTVVAAALLVPAAAMVDSYLGKLAALLGAVCLAVGAAGGEGSLGVVRGGPAAAVGHALAMAAGVVGLLRLRAARLPREEEEDEVIGAPPGRWELADLAALAFLISMAFMSLELVAGRLVTRHLGSSLFGWTSVIGVLLGGLSLGNLIGGRIADKLKAERQASWLFLAASMAALLVMALESPPPLLGEEMVANGSILTYAFDLDEMPWSLRVLTVVAAVFWLPAITMGTVSPVVTKLAIDRLRRRHRTGAAIGSVYAWGMVGSIAGTFLAGFVLIDALGTKGLVLGIAVAMAGVATWLGGIGHAAWAGVPIGLCAIAFAPIPAMQQQGAAWGLREPAADPDDPEGIAYLDESNYYYIKVDSESVPLDHEHDGSEDDDGTEEPFGIRRTLVLDNLVHGYFMLGHPQHIEYDYEFLYALVARRVAEAKAERLGLDEVSQVPLRALFLGGGSYTFPRYLQHRYPNAECDVAEIDPAVTAANLAAMGLPADTTIRTHWGDARRFVERASRSDDQKYDLVFGDAFNDFSVPWHLTTREFNERIDDLLATGGAYMINIIDVYRADGIAAERAVEEGQIDAVAAVLRGAGNDREGAKALARGLRTAWRAEDLGIRSALLGSLAAEAVDDRRTRAEQPLAGAIRGPVAAFEGRFAGDAKALAAIAESTLTRAQAERDQSAAAGAIQLVLLAKKRIAAEDALIAGGVGREAGPIAKVVADLWSGGPMPTANLLEAAGYDRGIEALSRDVSEALAAVEHDLRESPVLLARRVVHSAEEWRTLPPDRLLDDRREEVIRDRLREVGVREAGDYAWAIAEDLDDELIAGRFDDLSRRAAEAAVAYGTDADRVADAAAAGIAEARTLGAFLGSWVRTAGTTFDRLAVYGTDTIGTGYRETFVVVALDDDEPVDLDALGRHPGDPIFHQDDAPFEPDPYGPTDLRALDLRSRGIVLTDDYAPVENLLAPVAATRAKE